MRQSKLLFLTILVGLHLLFPSTARSTEAEEAQQDQEGVLAELEAAASADASEQSSRQGADATIAKDAAAEDPLNKLPQGAREVIGNEANPSISLILDIAFAYFSQEDRLRAGGHAPIRNGPAIQGAELALGAVVDPFFRVDMSFGLYHLHLEEIYLTTTSLPWNLQVRAGKYKSNVGRHNPTHLHQWHFVIQPFANQFMFGAEGMSLPGVEISYLFPLPWYLELSGSLQMGVSGSLRTKSLESGDPHFGDFIYPLRLVQFFDLTDDLSLQFGLNTVFGTSPDAPDQNNRTFAYGADLYLKWRPIGWGQTGYTYIAWVTEGWLREMEVAEDLWRDIGGYSDLIFGLTKQWEVALRGEYWHQLSGLAAVPYREMRQQEDPSLSDSQIINRDKFGQDLWKGTLAASFMPSHFSRIRLSYSLEHVEGFDNNQVVLLQMEVSAGAHGAHKY